MSLICEVTSANVVVIKLLPICTGVGYVYVYVLIRSLAMCTRTELLTVPTGMSHLDLEANT